MNGNCDSEFELFDGCLLYLLRLAKFSAQKQPAPISTSYSLLQLVFPPVEIKVKEKVDKIIELTALSLKLPKVTRHKSTPYQLRMRTQSEFIGT